MIARLPIAALALLTVACESQAAREAREVRESERRGEVAAVPVKLQGRVVDQAGLLSPIVEEEIAAQSQALERRTTDQLVVVTLKSLNGASIEQAGFALGNSWGLGRSDRDNGVLLLVAPNERRVRIEVGKGLEGLLTDERAAAIVRDMTPLLAADRTDRAIKRGVTDIVTMLAADPARPRYAMVREAA